MRTYSHAILTYGASRLANHGAPRKVALAAALGATLPDLPMALGAAWLWTRRKRFSRSDFDEQVCGRSLFREPDAALHSALVAVPAMLFERAFRRESPHGNRAPPSFLPRASAHHRAEDPMKRPGEESGETVIPANFVSAFLTGWAGHVLADFLTHGEDARPILRPVSDWRFESPVSYREKERYGKTFTAVEHAAVLATALLIFTEAWRTRQKAAG